MATTATLAEELATEFGEAYIDYDVRRQFKQWVSECVEMILAAARWPFQTDASTLDTTDGTRVYELGSAHGDIRVVQKADTGISLPYIPLEDLRRRGLDIRTEGEPALWYYDKLSDDGYLTIAFYPVPDGEYQYWIYRDLVQGALDDSSDVTIPLPADFYPVIRDGVRAFYRENTENVQLAQMAWQRYGQKLEMLRGKYLSPQALHHSLRAVDLPTFNHFDSPRLPSGY